MDAVGELFVAPQWGRVREENDLSDGGVLAVNLGAMAGTQPIILGGSGFVGSRLIRRLHARGVQGIRSVDIKPPAEQLPGVQYHSHDVCEPVPSDWGLGCDVLYNFAAVHRTPGHPDHAYYDTNVAGAINAAALAESCGISTMVFSSSISVYGPSEAVLTEDSPLKPVTSYGRSKRLAERIHQRWAADSPDRRLVVVRPGVIFGPGEGGNYSQLARALRRGYFFYPGRRDTIKSGGYVDELLETIDFALSRSEPFVLYNFAYPAPSTTEEIVRAFSAVAGFRGDRMVLPLPALLAAAYAFKLANTVGVRSWIHPDRVMKLVQSTRVAPRWLQDAGYVFKTDLRSALVQWRDETDGRFD